MAPPRRSAAAENRRARDAPASSNHVLITGHGTDRVAFDTARRTVPYRKIVLFTTADHAEEVAEVRESERLAGVEVDARVVDPADLLQTLNEANEVLREHARDEVRVHVAGASNLVTSALLLAAFENGVEAFFCHPQGVSRLPVIETVDLKERFDDTERAVLLAIPEEGAKAVTDLCETGLSLGAARAALLRLRAANLVAADARTAHLTASGRYYRAHLERRRHDAGALAGSTS